MANLSRGRDLLIKWLTAKVSPMVYFMMFISIFVGFCFMTGFLVGDGESLLFKTGTLIDAQWWGMALFVSSGIAEASLAYKNSQWAARGSFISFCLWFMATISLIQDHHWYAVIIVGVFHTAFQGYVYLASELGVLERVAIQDR